MTADQGMINFKENILVFENLAMLIIYIENYQLYFV